MATATRARRRGDPVAALLQLVERQQKVAARFGVRTRRELAKWCLLAWLTAERFAELPPVASFLREPRGSLSERLDAVLRLTAAALDHAAADGAVAGRVVTPRA